jgi:hypothetical protein
MSNVSQLTGSRVQGFKVEYYRNHYNQADLNKSTNYVKNNKYNKVEFIRQNGYPQAKKAEPNL